MPFQRVMTDRDELRRQRSGWYYYDWANSAFAMTILAALFGPYLDKVVVPPSGWSIPLLGIGPLHSVALFGYTLGASALCVLLTSPVLGAIADSSRSKKKFLMAFCYVGSAATMLMFFIGPGDTGLALTLFFIANICFVSGNVFYDAFLPHIAAPEDQDRVSGKGYAYGYAGGGLLFLAHLLLVQFHAQVGIADVTLAIRIALGSVGLWWGGFSIITFRRLKEPAAERARSGVAASIRVGFGRVIKTVAKVRSLKQLTIFLFAFMIYNDGIQTAISMSSIYASGELHFDTLTLMGGLLMVQFIGIAGSRLFGYLASSFGTKTILLASLVVWCAITTYGFFMRVPLDFWILCSVVGLVLGGSQALSRSLFSRIVPAGASAEFFGFFSVFEKFSAIWGPLVFAVVQQVSGSARNSIITLSAFFVVGFIILSFLNVRKAVDESRALEPELAA
jgi:MFS transporter, UMF1 family